MKCSLIDFQPCKVRNNYSFNEFNTTNSHITAKFISNLINSYELYDTFQMSFKGEKPKNKRLPQDECEKLRPIVERLTDNSSYCDRILNSLTTTNYMHLESIVEYLGVFSNISQKENQIDLACGYLGAIKGENTEVVGDVINSKRQNGKYRMSPNQLQNVLYAINRYNSGYVGVLLSQSGFYDKDFADILKSITKDNSQFISTEFVQFLLRQTDGTENKKMYNANDISILLSSISRSEDQNLIKRCAARKDKNGKAEMRPSEIKTFATKHFKNDNKTFVYKAMDLTKPDGTAVFSMNDISNMAQYVNKNNLEYAMFLLTKHIKDNSRPLTSNQIIALLQKSPR